MLSGEMGRDHREATITVPEAARILRVSRWLIYAAIERGEVQAIRVGKRYSVPVLEIDRLMGYTVPQATLEWARGECDINRRRYVKAPRG